MSALVLENSDEILYASHDAENCPLGPCPLHHRTEHHMRGWPQHYDSELQLVQRVCPHGTLHPDPDDRTVVDHECCHTGCCAAPEHGLHRVDHRTGILFCWCGESSDRTDMAHFAQYRKVPSLEAVTLAWHRSKQREEG